MSARQIAQTLLDCAVIAVLTAVSTLAATTDLRERPGFQRPSDVEFIRPGFVLTVQSAQIAADGTISVIYTIADSGGIPLDATGVATAGAVTVSFIAASIPKGQEQYTSYTTRMATGAISGTVTQAGADSGGANKALADGQYQYTFKTKAPAGFDTTATTTIGAYGSRNLTTFNLGTSYASATYNFVPNGTQVIVTRDVIKTASCNKCHDQLSFHGGSRRGIELCVLCHTPQTTDPDTGNTLDLKVIAHKIHMGAQLPSVIAGKPYQFIGFQNSVSDYSTVVFPSDTRRCESCHDQTTKAAQATAYLTRPTRASCGACHDNIDFVSGANHTAGAQSDDSQCSTCHIPQGQIDFDASIKGAHVLPTESSLLSGITATIQGVTTANAGSAPTVAFTLQDKQGKGVAPALLNNFGLTLAGPSTDYGNTNFGADVTTTGYVTENPTAGAVCSPSGACTYTFKHKIPADATGTYAIGIEARRSETILAGTPTQMTVQYGADNQVFNFSVDGSVVQPRRTVVAIANCNQCHTRLSVHGENRNQVEMCALCHNPTDTDAAVRVIAVSAADKALPPQGINFNLLVHRIHSGVNLAEDNRTYVVVGFRGSHNDFSDVRYPAFSPTGSAGDRRNCSLCHVNGSEQNLPLGFNAVVDPQGPINPIQATASACTGCHTSLSAASHTLSNTTVLGESCDICHGADAAFPVSAVHAQY